MDGTRFDSLAKAVAVGRTRRGALRLLGGGALGALGLAAGGTALAAPPERAKPRCTPGAEGDAFCQSTAPGTCLVGKCDVRDSGTYRCSYYQTACQTSAGATGVCCGYGSYHPGQCLASARACKTA